MSLFKVIVFLLIISTAIVDSRAIHKRQQDQRSSAYYTNSQFGSNPGAGVAYALAYLGLGANLYPIGNNWYIPGGPPYPYIDQFGYNMQPYSYLPNGGYMNSYNNFNYGQYGQYGNSDLNLEYSGMGQGYTGQSYVPQSSEWLPLPGRDRRGPLLENIMAPNMNNNPTLPRRK